jgi:hypothetical protein
MLIDDWTPIREPLPADEPVAENLPDDSILVLLAFEDGEVWPGYRDDDVWRDAGGMPIVQGAVTHWLHLPAAPERRST